MREIGDIVRAFERHRGERLALATLVQARGSSYRPPGARMLISTTGGSVGSLSGGCLEEEVVERAQAVLRTGVPALTEFDTRRRFGCHGTLEIFVERVQPEFLETLAHHFHARQRCVLATPLRVTADHAGSHFLAEDESLEGFFVHRIDPSPHLLIIGDGPDTTALCAFADALGWKSTLLSVAAELPDPVDEWTAAIVKTHNYGRDFAALRALLPLGLPYIGLLGPRARRDQLLGDLFDTGVSPGSNLFGPAGLDLGGDAPETIALAIIAEIQSVFAAAREPLSLRNRKAPIHAPRHAVGRS